MWPVRDQSWCGKRQAGLVTCPWSPVPDSEPDRTGVHITETQAHEGPTLHGAWWARCKN